MKLFTAILSMLTGVMLRRYLFDSSVYAQFWAEDKVGRKEKNCKKKQLNFFLFTSYYGVTIQGR